MLTKSRLVVASRSLLLGVAPLTLCAMAVSNAYAQDTSSAPPQQVAQASTDNVENVIVTGSLIHGAPTIGVPVTTVGPQDFASSGAVTIGDALENIPAITMIADSNVINGGGYVARDQNINLRNLSQKGTRTLLLVDGMRVPNQGNGGCQTDPSIIPQIAVDHVDVLTDGASATYGSDAIAGVVNVVMKHDFDGFRAQLQYGTSTDVSDPRLTESAIYGKTWEGGSLTVSAEHYDQTHISGTAFPFFTQNYAPYGFDNRMNIQNSRPGIVTIGAATAPANTPVGFAANLGTTCTNCYDIPKGQNGVGLTWAQIVANPGVSNEINIFSDGWESPLEKRTAVTASLEQRVTDFATFYLDGWYSNRSTYNIGSPGANAGTISVPNTNPYFPTGTPATSLNVYVDLANQVPVITQTNEVAARYDGGFHLDLPFDWTGKLYGSVTLMHEYNDTYGTINKNALSAAVGNTIAATSATATTPAISAYTLPTGLSPFNPFCDSTTYSNCNSAATLGYISGYSEATEQETLQEYGFDADGAVFNLPAGPLKAAVGTTYTFTAYSNISQATNANNVQIVNVLPAYDHRAVIAAFGQLNIPFFGPGFALPLVQKVDVQASIRYDHYSDFGDTTNPKIGMNWLVGEGLTFIGTYGTSFRAPSFQENANAGPSAVNSVSYPGGGVSNTVGTCPVVGQKAVPGSIAALIDPNCTAALQYLGGLSLLNAAQSASTIRPGGVTLSPEKGTNTNLGFDFAPSQDSDLGFLEGLNIQMTYWYIKINNKLQGYYGLTGVGNGFLDNPVYTPSFLTAANDPNFQQHVLSLLTNPYSTLPASIASNISFIADGAIRNIGSQSLNGVDYNYDYSWDMANVGMPQLGVWDAGMVGTYTIDNKSQGGPGQPIVSYYSQNADGRNRYRVHLGTTVDTGNQSSLNITGFMDYIGHFNPLANPLPPSCFQLGNASCASYGPQFAQYTSQTNLTTEVPSVYTFDLSIGYLMNDDPGVSVFGVDVLKNSRIQLTINNIFDKAPPFEYEISPPGGGAAHAFYTSTATSELNFTGRIINIALTKDF